MFVEKRLKNGLSIRGDSYYCPLSFQLETYWNCENECYNCYFRRLNRTWGKELRPLDVELFRKKLENGLKNKNPRSSLAWAIKQKKTLKIGNKADPYQKAEINYRVTREAIRVLLELDWSFVIQTKFVGNMMKDLDLLGKKRHLVTVMPVVSPGLEEDWKVFEKEGTDHPYDRLRDLYYLKNEGFNVGINGEPFIPGYHTLEDFRKTLRLLKSYGFISYNTYHLHFNDWVAKRFYEIELDIEKIWFYNRDEQWKKILPSLIEESKKWGIDLGCPDFVHSGDYQEKANTCCGINVDNPCTFNMIYWKKAYLGGTSKEAVIESTWDGVGDKEFGRALINGEVKNYYDLEDMENCRTEKFGLLKDIEGI